MPAWRASRRYVASPLGGWCRVGGLRRRLDQPAHPQCLPWHGLAACGPAAPAPTVSVLQCCAVSSVLCAIISVVCRHQSCVPSSVLCDVTIGVAEFMVSTEPPNRASPSVLCDVTIGVAEFMVSTEPPNRASPSVLCDVTIGVAEFMVSTEPPNRASPSVFGRNLQCEPARQANTRDACHWSHAWQRFKRSKGGVKLNATPHV